MIQQEEARAKILEALTPLASRVMPLADSLDCFAAKDCFAGVALPPFHNSAMDGYAVDASSCTPGCSLRLVGEQPAGLDRHLVVRVGEAVRILTGAPMPAGADAVVMQEDVTAAADHIIVNTSVVTGEFVRMRGGDVAAGQKLLSAGQRISPATLALLAAQGLALVEIGTPARVSIVSTGDEIAAPGAELAGGQIYDSNTPLLQALVRRCGAEIASIEHTVDDERATTEAVRRGIESDVLIITGGVSVGARDFVKSAIAAVGGVITLWRVLVKPGKPFLFGRAGDCAIFGLPGNPVSAFVTFLLFVRPALLKLAGANEDAATLPMLPATVTHDISNPGDRPHYVRGVLVKSAFTPFGRQESHAIFGLSRSNALLLVPPAVTIRAGQTASIMLFD